MCKTPKKYMIKISMIDILLNKSLEISVCDKIKNNRFFSES